MASKVPPVNNGNGPTYDHMERLAGSSRWLSVHLIASRRTWNSVHWRARPRATAPAQWVKVVGEWTGFQFPERRMPTLDEIKAAAPFKRNVETQRDVEKEQQDGEE